MAVVQWGWRTQEEYTRAAACAQHHLDACCCPRIASRSVLGRVAPLPAAPPLPRRARPGPSRVTTRRRSASNCHVQSCRAVHAGCGAATSWRNMRGGAGARPPWEAGASRHVQCAFLRMPAVESRLPPTCLGTTTSLSSGVISCKVLAVSRTTMPCRPRYRGSAGVQDRQRVVEPQQQCNSSMRARHQRLASAAQSSTPPSPNTHRLCVTRV